jgi:ribosome-associated toxin RatA of RatAB toxin-antitoxin module
MRRLEMFDIQNIVRTHNIKYEILKPRSRKTIATRLSRVYNAPPERLFDIVADLSDHSRLFSHCKTAQVVDKTGLDNVLEANQFVVVSDVAEGGSKLAVSRYTLERPRAITEHLITDPFPAKGVADRKNGLITWKFAKVGESRGRMTCESEFEIETGKVFVRGLIDHVWLDFFENMMIETGELAPDQKLTFPPEFKTRDQR